MEPEGSLPCSQAPSTGPYPKLNQSSPYRSILSIIRFNINPTHTPLQQQKTCFLRGPCRRVTSEPSLEPSSVVGCVLAGKDVSGQC
jgi:hypothetical protein